MPLHVGAGGLLDGGLVGPRDRLARVEQHLPFELVQNRSYFIRRVKGLGFRLEVEIWGLACGVGYTGLSAHETDLPV